MPVVTYALLLSAWSPQPVMQVMHNDIKSSNILLSKDATVAKIADVGTSRIAEVTHSTPSLPCLGTFAYAAPEQLMGQRDVCTDKVALVACHTVKRHRSQAA